MKAPKKFFAAALMMISAGVIHAAIDNTWKADEEGEWSGYWTDDAHWYLGAIGEGHTARFDLKKNGPVEVLFPSGAYTNSAEIFLRGWDTRFDITLNGTNTAYVMGGSDKVDHTTRPFFPTFGNYNFNSYTYTSPLAKAPLKFTNFKIRYASLDDQFLLDFDGGDYNFYDPCGTVLTGPILNFFTMTLDTFSPNRIVRFADATVRCGGLNISCGENGVVASTNLFLLENSDVKVFSTLHFPLNSDGSDGWENPSLTEIRLDNSSLTVNEFGFHGRLKDPSTKNQEPCVNKKFILTLDNGSILTQTGYDFASSDSHYVINILNGSQMLLKRSVYFGRNGTGTTEVNVINTDWSSQGSTMYIGPSTNDAASYPTMRGNLNISNSHFTVGNSLRFSSASFNIIDSTVEGFNVLMTDPDQATAELHVNGGVYRLNKMRNDFISSDGGDLFHDWDKATIGPRGFTVDNSCIDCIVSQDFSNAPEGPGTLTFTGSKTFTLTSTNTTVSTVVVAGAGVTFGDGAMFKSTLIVTNAASVKNLPANGLTGLILGNGATKGALLIDPAKSITVEGAISFVNPAFTFTTVPTDEAAKTLFSANSSDPETIALWKNLGTPPGLPDGYGAIFDVASENGKLLFTMTMRPSATYIETLDEGRKTISTNCTVSTIDIISARTAANTELSFTGKLSHGRFEKYGEGTVLLSNPENKFILGFGLYEGVLAVTSAGALGHIANSAVSTLAGGALRLDLANPSDMIKNPIEIATTESATAPVVIDTVADATMSTWEAKAGSVIKTGAGRLSLIADAPAKIAISDGDGIDVRGTRLLSSSPIAFKDDGTYLSGAYAGLTVLEGELRLTGAAKINAKQTFAVGGPLADLERNGGQVGLVIDAATVDTANSPGGLAFATATKLGVTVPESMNAPYLYVTNGAHLICHNFFGLTDSDGTKETPLKPVFVIDGSTLETKSQFISNNSSKESTVLPRWTIRNAGRIYANDHLLIYGSDNFTFDRSELAKNQAGEPLKITVCSVHNGISNDFSFVNGSVLKCHTICAVRTSSRPFVLTFDDSEWNPGSETFTFNPTNHDLRVVSKGNGLVLAPQEGGAYTWRLDLTGTGGLVKRGEGTLTINATNMLYSGVTRVECGTLDLDGSSPARMTFAGPGTLANGTLISPVFNLAGADLQRGDAAVSLAADATVSGYAKVDLGRTSEESSLTPLPSEAFTVLKYEAAAPDVSSWRLRGSGLKGVRGVFNASNGVVTCSIEPTGLTVIIR